MAIDWPTAADDGVKTLYHYQSANCGWLARILFKGDIRFSNPKEFNDPWDCKPGFKEVKLNDPEDIEKYVRWFIKQYREDKRKPALTEDQYVQLEDGLRQNPSLLESEIVKFTPEVMGKVINEGCWMYCLTAKLKCSLMWAHYADKHKGVCLGFSTRNNEEFSKARRVIYEKTYPVFKLYDDDETTQFKMLLTKSDDWKYEKEYRLIHFLKPEQKNTDGYFEFPAGSLSSIHLGCQMSDETIKMIVAAVEKLEFRPDIIQMVRHPSKYVLKRKCIYKGNAVRG